jgi:hypothetical protein
LLDVEVDHKGQTPRRHQKIDDPNNSPLFVELLQNFSNIFFGLGAGVEFAYVLYLEPKEQH